MLTKNKILLINPPFNRLYHDQYSLTRLPLSLAYIAGAILNNTQWDAKIFNADFHPQEISVSTSFLTGKGFENYINSISNLNHSVYEKIRALIRSFSPSVVGITSMTQNFKSALNVAKIAKEINRNIIVVLGGSHVTLVKEDCLHYEEIDIGVVGEGEKTIVDLLNAIEKNYDITKIPGLICKKQKNFSQFQQRPLIQNLDALEFPFLSAKKALYEFENYPPQAFQYIFSSRGCPFNCIFCGSKYIWGRKPRFRSIDNVLNEIATLTDNHINSFHFDDDTFGLEQNHLKELCEKIKKNLPKIEWSCEMHVKCVNEDIIANMKKAGCRAIILGFESGNNEILKKIRKNITVEESLKAAQIIRKNNILLNGFFMVGFPWETEETLKDTLNLIKKLNCNLSGYSIFTPYKGTEAFEVCQKMGLIPDNYDPSLYNHQSPNNCFCKIPKDRFRKICHKIEATIDHLNYVNRLKLLMSREIIDKVRRNGLKNSIKKALTIFCRR